MKILFASLTLEGHFNPLTGIARAAQEAGHEVAFYTGTYFASKLAAMGVRHFPYRAAREVNSLTINEDPRRSKLKGPLQIMYDARAFFTENVGAFFEDLEAIRREFPYDVLVDDMGVYVHRLFALLTNTPTVSVVVIGDMERDPLVPPMFFGFQPPRSTMDRLLQRIARAATDQIIMRPAKKRYREILAGYGLPFDDRDVVTDEPYKYSTAIIQTGTPGLDFPRSRTNPKVRHVGALLPWRDPSSSAGAVVPPAGAKRRVLMTQGTVDNEDFTKLVIPALEGLRDLDLQLVVATGGKGTQELRRRFTGADIVIEDFVDFHEALGSTDVYVTNGGLGGVLLALSHGVPIVAAGLNEGKSDVNARIAYRGLGVDLRTERPKPEAIRRAVEHVLSDAEIGRRVRAIQSEFAGLDPLAESLKVIEETAARRPSR